MSNVQDGGNAIIDKSAGACYQHPRRGDTRRCHMSEPSTATKVCSKCCQEKTVSSFSKNKSRPDGYAHYCKACASLARSAWGKANPESVKAGKRRYYHSDPERERERARQYRQENPETIKRHSQNRSEKYPEKIKAVNAVNGAVARGVLPHVTACACASCQRKAAHYHHESYARPDWLKVIPLCRSCHRLIHTGTLKMEFPNDLN